MVPASSKTNKHAIVRLTPHYSVFKNIQAVDMIIFSQRRVDWKQHIQLHDCSLSWLGTGTSNKKVAGLN
jgi:hypothetical protein